MSTDAEKLAAIRALHAQDPDCRDRSVCIECTRWLRANAPGGRNATAVWPCPTAQIVLAEPGPAVPPHTIDRAALASAIGRVLGDQALSGSLWTDQEYADRILVLVRPVEGVVLSRGSDEAKAIIRARDLLARPGDDYWFANTLRALAARLEASS